MALGVGRGYDRVELLGLTESETTSSVRWGDGTTGMAGYHKWTSRVYGRGPRRL